MPETILIAVCDGFNGYGDFLFALKMAARLKKHYVDLYGTDVPEIKLVCDESAQKKIRDLKGDTEFEIDVLTPVELQTAIKHNGMKVASIIEGPVFKSAFIEEVNAALANHPPVPLVLMPEYSYSTTEKRQKTDLHFYWRTRLSQFDPRRIIYTGMNSKKSEKGIILSDNLITPEPPSVLQTQLDPKIKSALMGTDDISVYQGNTDLSFQYSHDFFPTVGKKYTIFRFLEMHRIYSKGNVKNQDVILVGSDMSRPRKHQAFNAIKDKLIADGFTKISFYDADTGTEEYIHGDAQTVGRHYRAIYTKGMSHRSMVAAQALSGDFIGATGDQSFAEAVSGDKVLVYECLLHKIELCNDYYAQLKALDPSCAEVLDLLKTANTQPDYARLEALLTPEMKVKLKELAQRFRESLGNLIESAANAVMPGSLIGSLIENGKANPYAENIVIKNEFGFRPNAVSLFERALRAGQYSVVSYVAKHHTNTEEERQKFCELLMKRNKKGQSYLSLASAAIKHGEPGITRARYLVTRSNLAKYEAKPNTQREVMANAFNELISAFNTLSPGYLNEDAFIGLMLLTTKNIANEYTFMSPDKGLFFGSRFYSNLVASLKELGINLKNITPREREYYYKALAKVMNNNPQLVANDYILNSLSKETNITLPKVPPLLTKKEAEKLLANENLTTSDPTIINTPTGIYKVHSIPLGKGGWGSVYAGRYYTKENGQLKISPPLAIKELNGFNQILLRKEKEMFEKVYPGQHFAQFNHNNHPCLAMPLFAGLPLDEYLKEPLELSMETRRGMAISLLENLYKIHQANITHNDLKPKNILYDPVTQKMHIVDFGCAEEKGTMLKYQNFNKAIFAFEMPPEYMDGAKTSPEMMDIFSLTPVIAEILGANRKAFVEARMERALSGIGNNLPLVEAIRQAFHESDSLEIALYKPKVTRFSETEDFDNFVKFYIKEQYDFSPYAKLLGNEIIELLNSMQDPEPKNRPSIDEALNLINHQEEIRLEI
jgi:hypothetical protein